MNVKGDLLVHITEIIRIVGADVIVPIIKVVTENKQQKE